MTQATEKLHIVLASLSPRRVEILRKIPFVEFEVIPSNADEGCDFSRPSHEIVTDLSFIKAKSVFDLHGGTVLGADTLVFLDGMAMQKPKDENEALSMLKMLCGRTHEVVTGVSVISEQKIVSKYEKTYVTFGAFNDKIVYNYIKSEKPFDKAGAYGIQDVEIKDLIERVDGDIFNVIGLPLELTTRILKENFYKWQF